MHGTLFNVRVMFFLLLVLIRQGGTFMKKSAIYPKKFARAIRAHHEEWLVSCFHMPALRCLQVWVF